MFPSRRLHGFRLGSDFLVCLWRSFMIVLFLVFFGVRSVHFGWIFEDTCLSTVVTGFFWSSSLQPRPCRFFLLDVGPARAREVTPWTGACGSRLMVFSVVSGSSGGRLLQRRSLVVARVLHASSPVTVFSTSILFLGFFFELFLGFFSFFFSQFASMMLKCYQTIC
jgi:hypothetical protein